MSLVYGGSETHRDCSCHTAKEHQAWTRGKAVRLRSVLAPFSPGLWLVPCCPPVMPTPVAMF